MLTKVTIYGIILVRYQGGFMYKNSDLTKTIYKPKDVSSMLGVTNKTLYNWEAKGKISFQRNVKNRRFITRENLIHFLSKQGLYFDDSSSLKRDVIYARVSSHDQKSHGDLDRQVWFLIESVSDLQNVIVLSEVGSGLNDKRKKLKQLLKMVMNNEVNRVFITYRDRLTRFGFYYLETMFNAKGVEIVVIQQTADKTSVEQELMNDVMSLTASFSGKLYEMKSRKNKNENNEDEERRNLTTLHT